jgi:hypothetical protein
MEVHAHTPRKKWTHYFWEFLMLFLAVFCGFLAEYQLEHKIEKDRAKELAKNFYQELKNDSASAVLRVQNRMRQEEALKYIANYFKDSNLTRLPKEFAINFVYGVNFRTPSVFEPRTIILEQLKNSGSLRYFKNDELQKLIGDLTVAIKNIYDRQEVESQNRQQYLNPMLIDYYDFDFDAKLREGGKSIFEALKNYQTTPEIIPFHFTIPARTEQLRISKTLSFYTNLISSTRITFIRDYEKLNAGLLELLRKEYHLE